MRRAEYSTAEWQKAAKDDEIKKAITGGVKQEMDPYGTEVKPEQIDVLAGMVRSLGG